MRIRTAIPAAVAAAALTALAVLPAQAATAASNSPTAQLTSHAHATTSGPNHLFATPQAAPLRRSFATAQDATAAPAFTAVTAEHTATGLALKAVIDAANPAATVTAEFQNTDGSPVTDSSGAVIPVAPLTWSDTDSAWELPLDLPRYNTYNVVLRATNPIGTTPWDLNDVPFVLQPQLASASIGPAVIDYAHQNVTATGKVTLWDPRTGQSQAPGSSYTPVYLTGPGDSGVFAWGSTQADGSFTVSGGVGSTFQGGLFQVYAQNGSATSNSVSQNVNASTVSATRIVLDRTAVSGATAGRAYTVAGTVQYQTTTGAWVPAAGVYLDYEVPGTTYWNTDWSPTDAKGRFAISSSIPIAAGYFRVRPSSAYPWSTFLKAAPAVQVAFTSIHQAVTLRLSSQSINEYSELSFFQSITSTNNHVAYNKVYLLVSPDGKTGWKNLGYIPVKSADYGSGTGQITAWVANPHGWYRIYMTSGTGYTATYSNTIHVFRYETRVTGGKPNHLTISKNHYLTFTGHVQRRGYGSWQSIANTHVYLVFRPTGSKTWYYVTKVRANKYGYYRISGKATRSGTWSVVWWTSNQWYVDSNGPMTWVRVR